MGYKTVHETAESEFMEKKSTFIGACKRVFSEEEAKSFIGEIKEKYKDARHHVYAYTVGEDGLLQRYSDDGEPQGTGGIPMLEVIKKNQLKNTCVVVTRYFGGILLGAGGLTRAYVKGASLAIEASGIVERVEGYTLTLHAPYDLAGKIEHLLKEKELFIQNIAYTEEVQIIVPVLAEQKELFTNEIINLTANRVKIYVSDPKLFYKLQKELVEEFEDG